VSSPLPLAGRTWPEAGDAQLLVVPVGSCEQHGPHLPLDTDLRIAVELCERLVAARTDAVVAPPIAIGASGEHESFPGTLSIGTPALEAVIVELGRSALPPPDSSRPRPFSTVLFVNGHGGNIEALERGTALLVAEGRDVAVWHPRVPGGDSHAGRTETSMMLHLDPGVVRVDRLESGSTARWREIGAEVVANGLAAVSPNGVLGDPTLATEAEGRAVFDALVADLVTHVAVRRPDPGA
jgi:mycofactocin system creatininase family protein